MRGSAPFRGVWSWKSLRGAKHFQVGGGGGGGGGVTAVDSEPILCGNDQLLVN